MINPDEFDFGTNAVATAYDDFLVPLMFEPWAAALIGEHTDWAGRDVLDLATGTGVVASLVAERVGAHGRVIGTDLNGEMLARARLQSANTTPTVEFMESPASPLMLPDASVDIALCQQGFQFFQDRDAAAGELHRVLRPGGQVLASTWCSVSECAFFGWICEALAEIGEPDIEAMMRLPFDYLPASELSAPFEAAGFLAVTVKRRTSDLVMSGGVAQGIRTAYATPIGPKLAVLAKGQRSAFQDSLQRRIEATSPDGVTMGQLVSNVLRAVKSG
jgi:SAM-dependent methyltransferase